MQKKRVFILLIAAATVYTYYKTSKMTQEEKLFERKGKEICKRKLWIGQHFSHKTCGNCRELNCTANSTNKRESNHKMLLPFQKKY